MSKEKKGWCRKGSRVSIEFERRGRVEEGIVLKIWRLGSRSEEVSRREGRRRRRIGRQGGGREGARLKRFFGTNESSEEDGRKGRA